LGIDGLRNFWTGVVRHSDVLLLRLRDPLSREFVARISCALARAQVYLQTC
jgi:hypothetical protein